jgi:type IV secretory pathway VirB4 component
MTVEKLTDEIMSNLNNKPHNWRIGQFVFNYIDEVYHVARTVQFIDKVDCYYDDKNINNFIKHAAKYIE